MTNEPLHVAVVGPGQVAELHTSLLATEGHRLEWVVGSSPEQAAAFAARRGFDRSTADLHHALEDPAVDAVVICSPNHLHASQARACLSAGKHVLVEIPLAMSFAEGRSLAESARALGLVLMVGHNHRYLGGVRWIRERVAGGELTPLNIAARYLLLRRDNVSSSGRARSWTDSLLWHHGQHSVDTLLHVLGVSGTGQIEIVPWIGTVDVPTDAPQPMMDVSIGIRTRAGQIGTALLSYNSSVNIYDYTVVCREDTLVVDGGEVRNRDGIVVDFRSDQHDGGDGARRSLIREFAAAIRERRPPTVSAESVLPALEVLQLVQDASGAGAPY